MSAASADMLTELGAGAKLGGAPWLDARRETALAAYRAKGVPHRRVEDWKYSDLRAVLSADAAVPVATAGNPFAEIAGTRLDIRDGKLVTALAAMPKTVDAFDLANVANAPDWVQAHLGRTGKDGMAAASLALMAGGVALRVASGVMVEEPLHLNFVSEAAHHGRVLIVLEDGAALTLLESHVPVTDKRAVFVGLAGYEAAGGSVLRDLFAEDNGGYLPDPALLRPPGAARTAG